MGTECSTHGGKQTCKVDVSCELQDGTEGTENGQVQVGRRGDIRGKGDSAATPPGFLRAGSGNDLGQFRTAVCFFEMRN